MWATLFWGLNLWPNRLVFPNMGTPERHEDALARLKFMTLLPPERVAALYEEAKREIQAFDHLPKAASPLASRVFNVALAKCIEEEKHLPKHPRQ